MRLSSCPVAFVEKTVVSPLNCFVTLNENQLAVNITAYLWTLNYILLICIFIITPVITLLITVAL